MTPPRARYSWRILLIDDDEDDYFLTRQMLCEAREGTFSLDWASSFERGQAAIATGTHDAVIVDYDLGARNGIDLIREAVSAGYAAPMLLITGRGAYDVDFEAMQAGAVDYLTKDEVTTAFLERAIRYAIERKKHARALQESQADLAHAQAVSHTGSWRLDLQNNALKWSDETYRIFGIPIGTPLSYETFLAAIYPEDREPVDRAWAAALQGAQYDIEHRILVGESIRWVRERAELEFDARGTLTSGFGTVQDITERKQTENELREAKERFRIALGNPAIAVFSTDRELRYNWFYSSAMAGFSDSFIGKRDDQILSGEDAAEFMEIKTRAITQRAAVQDEITLMLGEKQRSLMVSVEPYYDTQGSLNGVIGACYDVTEQRRLEAESFDHLTQMEVHQRLLEQRENERQQIARDLHDGPVQDLAGLLFNIQLAKESLQDPNLRAEFDKVGAIVKQSINDLRGMINELRPPSLARFGITRALQYYSESFQARHPELKMELNLQVPVDEAIIDERVSLTAYRIYQEALANVSRHARASTVWVRFKQVGEFIVLEVRDDGTGFQVLPGQLDQAHDNHFGLVGMRERAETVGGQYTLASQPGKGTSIYVTLPLSPEGTR